MITPIIRKELYLAKIIGEDVDIPETAKTREELFFLKILDNSSKIPEPITREELFLAKIAGQDVELPEPKTRLELFLAKAAGVEIETPTPITREEIFWSNYSAIVDFEVEGVPPLTYKAIEGTLENYRIYGNTVDGESVGDRTGNLFDKNGVWVNGYINDNGELAENSGIATYTEFINVKPDTDYSLICDSSVPEGVRFNFYDSSKNFISRIFRNMGNPTVTTPSTCEYITLSINKNQIRYLMITEGSTAPTEYEPYGYKVPIAVINSGTTSNETIYLPEPIKMVGDEAEYIDYADQKLHRVGADDIDVTLPVLPTLAGTNVLSVGTAAQPSKVYVKYKGERQ